MKLVLRQFQSPGDVLMLTAAVRDLHRAHPDRFQTAVQTSCDELWGNNPHVVPLSRLGNPDATIDCGYPLIHQSNRRPLHFIHGMALFLEAELGVRIPVSAFRGEIHLSAAEVESPLPDGLRDAPHPLWIMVAGGKLDFTAKWWNPASFQAVVDAFRGRIRFVQCGGEGHWHPPLSGVINLVGRTSIRQFIRLMYHCDGVVCPVTFAMHLAAAVPLRAGVASRPCVVIAGGREPPHWEMYPTHQYLHTVGAMECCAAGGCWKNRCQAVGDGDPADADRCVHPVSAGQDLLIPRCMEMITPQRVIQAIEVYLEGSAQRSAAESRAAGLS